MSLVAHPVEPWTVAEIASVVAAFDLGDFERTQVADLSEAGWDTGRARCRVATGSGEYFLKKHHPAVVRRESHDVIAEFRALGGRAPEVLSTATGETWYDAVEWVAEVHRIVAGAPPERPGETAAVEAAHQLALLHRMPLDRVRSQATHWYDYASFLDDVPAIAARFRAAGLNFSELERVLPDETGQLSEELPCTVTHGDLWRGNWVVKSGHVTALTDFDWVCPGARIDDLADVLLAFGSDRDIPLGRRGITKRSGPILKDRMGAMLSSYGADFTAAEREAFPHALRMAWLRHTSWLLQIGGDEVYLGDALQKVLRIIRLPDEELNNAVLP